MALPDEEKLVIAPPRGERADGDYEEPPAGRSGAVVVTRREPDEARAAKPSEALPETTVMGLPAVVEEEVTLERAGPAAGAPAGPDAPSAFRGTTMMGVAPARPGRPTLAPGTVFGGDFRIVRTVAQGGMGTVYEAEQLSTGRLRALKVLHRLAALDEQTPQRFLQEARIKARVGGEHVVDAIVAGIDPGTGEFWIAMELLEGETLAERIARLGPGAPMPADDAWRVLSQLCRGLAQAHEQGVVHRDLKPANVFLAHAPGGGFTVKILDFGIAHLLDADRDGSLPSTALGTPLWMAPEQAMQSEITPAADVWAVGLLAFRLLSGRMYWLCAASPEIDLPTLLDEILAEPLVSATTRAEALGCEGRLPDGFDAWFARCVARDAADRYRSAREMAAALADVVASATSVPVLDYAPERRPPSARPRARVHTRPVPMPSPPPRTPMPTPPGGVAPSRPPPFAELPPGPSLRSPTPAGAMVLARPASVPPPARTPPPPEPSNALGLVHVPVAPRPEDLVVPFRTLTAPAPRASRPSRAPSRPHAAVAVAFVLGSLSAFALHVALTRRAAPRDDASVAPPRVAQATPGHEPGAGLVRSAIAGPPAWAPGTARVWSGSMAGEAGAWSFYLVLRVSESGAATGYFSWASGAGEQVRESVSGTYEAVLGGLDLHGTLSTNPTVFPVNAYQLRVMPDGSLAGATLDNTARLAASLTRGR